MPQSGTGVSVEAVDPVFQTKMLEMLKQTGRPEMVVGWYHSHPGFGCWMSGRTSALEYASNLIPPKGVDINTQQSFEALNQRAVAVVIDPVQSVKGKVVIDCFRLINPQLMMLGQEPRQTTSNVGHLRKASIQALIHGLNRHYYSMVIDYRKNELEEQMLTNLYKKTWIAGLTTLSFASHTKANKEMTAIMTKHSTSYNFRVREEEGKSHEEMLVATVGKVDPKRHLKNGVNKLMAVNILQVLGIMLTTIVF